MVAIESEQQPPDGQGQELANRGLHLSDLPDYRQVDFEPVAARFRRYTLISTLAYSVLPAISTLVAWLMPFALFDFQQLSIFTGILAVVFFLVGVFRWIDAGYRGWALRQHDIIAIAGVLWRGITALPIARIQHVETTHGPLERAHGLARLKLYTAGGLTADLEIVGLERETADQMREHLVEQIRKRDEGVSHHSDE